MGRPRDAASTAPFSPKWIQFKAKALELYGNEKHAVPLSGPHPSPGSGRLGLGSIRTAAAPTLRAGTYLGFATAGGQIVGYEALLRWAHPTRGSIPPETFVPIAEDVGAIRPIGERMLREACAAAMQWPEYNAVAVNVSAVQFQLPNLAAIVEDALLTSGLSASRLELEVTESVMLRDRGSALATLHRLKALGVRIVMDDFGTGYSSLSNLQAFPFDKIKIDRSFASHVTDDESARSIIRAIVGLGRSLDLPVVAEGVETEAHRLMVLEDGCPQKQGFLFGGPAEAVVGIPGLFRVVAGGGCGVSSPKRNGRVARPA
ncbi:MAG: EAL domain-containing protein [Alphaproteobacteria bacterium]|nr:MAG: EAL domain-containing protein [Alphaproteobacteria bacterium]